MARAFPKAITSELKFDCPVLLKFRRDNQGYLGERALMHVGCKGNKVCVIRWTAGLSDSNLVALFLHEFGHVFGGDDEPAANSWVERNFGFTIQYKGPLDIEWIPPVYAKMILAAHSSSPGS